MEKQGNEELRNETNQQDGGQGNRGTGNVQLPEPREVKLWEPEPEYFEKLGGWLTRFGLPDGTRLEKCSIQEQYEAGVPFNRESEKIFFEAGVIPTCLYGTGFENLYLITKEQERRLAMLAYDPEDPKLQLAEFHETKAPKGTYF